ncbi:MAG: hypothetical protein N4A35_10125 [Flavobacteriales bacterium]|jgi:hypothetical protein|nr:hypothetical protein [Flavobacteriales bacterium]
MSENKSVLSSIFKRKGAEGDYTKIINSNTETQNLKIDLNSNEKAEVLFLKEKSFLLITDKRVLYNDHIHNMVEFSHESILKVKIALEEEYKIGNMNTDNFTKIKIIDNKEYDYIVEIEKGKPYNGIYQVLHFIASKKNNRNHKELYERGLA